jgi:hypothetical protein
MPVPVKMSNSTLGCQPRSLQVRFCVSLWFDACASIALVFADDRRHTKSGGGRPKGGGGSMGSPPKGGGGRPKGGGGSEPAPANPIASAVGPHRSQPRRSSPRARSGGSSQREVGEGGIFLYSRRKIGNAAGGVGCMCRDLLSLRRPDGGMPSLPCSVGRCDHTLAR